MEAVELRNLRVLQKRRREARTTALKAADIKRKEDAGWVLTAHGMWMYPGIVNRSYREGRLVPPRPFEHAAKPIDVPGVVPPTAPPALSQEAAPAGAAMGHKDAGSEYLVAIPIKVRWIIQILNGQKGIDFRKIPWYKPRFLKPGRLATQVRFVIGKGGNAAFATYRIAKCEVMRVADVPAGLAPEPGTDEHAEVFGGDDETLAIHLGELVETSPGLFEQFIGGGAPHAPAAALEWVSRASSRGLADQLLAKDGWHLWDACLGSAVGSRIAVSCGGQLLGSVQVLQSLQIGSWKPRATGYKWVAVRDRLAVDKASFAVLQEAVPLLAAAPDAYAVQVVACKAFAPTAFAPDGAALLKLTDLKQCDQQLVADLEAGGAQLEQGHCFKLASGDDYRCMRLVMLSGFLQPAACSRYACAGKAASVGRFLVIGSFALRTGGLAAYRGAAVVTCEFQGSQNSEHSPTGLRLNSGPEGPHTHFARAACVAIQFSFASRVFRAQLEGHCERTTAGMILCELLSGQAAQASIVQGSFLHNSFLVDRYQLNADTGLREDLEAVKNESLRKNYYATPRMILDYVKALQPDGWDVIYCDSLQFRDITKAGTSLKDALGIVDAYPPAANPVVFILLGAGKAFSIVRFRSGVLSFDSHQRSADGVFLNETCVGQHAVTAGSLLGSLEPCYKPGSEFDVYVLWRGAVDV